MKATMSTIGKLDAIDRNKLGMALFLVNEAVFFALLIFAYINYRSQFNAGPNPSSVLEPGITAIYTVCLLASSLTIWFADKSLERGSHGGLIAWLVATIALGAIFLVGQGLEYARLLSQNVTVSRNLFSTTFFTMTGFHGLHVFVGLIMLTILAGLALGGDFRGRKSSALSAVSLYWHFVDAVWVVIFSVVYLWGM